MLITPEVKHGIVNRVQNTIFSYQGWPTVARDENGTLYGLRWNPDERIEIGNDDLSRVHKVVAITL